MELANYILDGPTDQVCLVSTYNGFPITLRFSRNFIKMVKPSAERKRRRKAREKEEVEALNKGTGN